jgi:hypothetical protein
MQMKKPFGFNDPKGLFILFRFDFTQARPTRGPRHVAPTIIEGLSPSSATFQHFGFGDGHAGDDFVRGAIDRQLIQPIVAPHVNPAMAFHEQRIAAFIEQW